jgi:hypothetical protein
MMAAPLMALAARAEARDYTSAAEVLAEIDRLEGDVDARLAAWAEAVPSSVAFTRSVRADHERHRVSRAVVRQRLRLAAAALLPAAKPARASLTLAQMQAVAQDLVHAYAEGLPAIADARAVDALARDMVDDARHLAVLQMWSEAQEGRG